MMGANYSDIWHGNSLKSTGFIDVIKFSDKDMQHWHFLNATHNIWTLSMTAFQKKKMIILLDYFNGFASRGD